MSKKSHLKRNVAIGTVIAAGAGYVTGLLTAPKSGKETREDISKTANKARIDAEKKLKKVYAELQDLIQEAEKRRKALTEKGRVELDKALEIAKTSRDKARVVISSVHTGEADDPNLQKALDELKAAQKNLVTYLKK